MVNPWFWANSIVGRSSIFATHLWWCSLCVLVCKKFDNSNISNCASLYWQLTSWQIESRLFHSFPISARLHWHFILKKVLLHRVQVTSKWCRVSLLNSPAQCCGLRPQNLPLNGICAHESLAAKQFANEYVKACNCFFNRAIIFRSHLPTRN